MSCKELDTTEQLNWLTEDAQRHQGGQTEERHTEFIISAKMLRPKIAKKVLESIKGRIIYHIQGTMTWLGEI